MFCCLWSWSMPNDFLDNRPTGKSFEPDPLAVRDPGNLFFLNSLKFISIVLQCSWFSFFIISECFKFFGICFIFSSSFDTICCMAWNGFSNGRPRRSSVIGWHWESIRIGIKTCNLKTILGEQTSFGFRQFPFLLFLEHRTKCKWLKWNKNHRKWKMYILEWFHQEVDKWSRSKH